MTCLNDGIDTAHLTHLIKYVGYNTINIFNT